MIDAGEHTIGQELEYTPYQLQLMKALLGAFPEATFTLRNTMRWVLLNPAGAPDLPAYKNSTLYDADYRGFDECATAAATAAKGWSFSTFQMEQRARAAESIRKQELPQSGNPVTGLPGKPPVLPPRPQRQP